MIRQKEDRMRKVLSMVAMVAAFALVVGLGVTAFAQGVGVNTGVPTVSTTDDPSGSSDDPGDDISGNCDETEHANDPECQDTAGGAGDDDATDDDADDNSGPSENSGPGDSDDGSDDDSGSGSDDDDSDDDSPGSGSDDDDSDDNSGSGSDDDEHEDD